MATGTRELIFSLAKPERRLLEAISRRLGRRLFDSGDRRGDRPLSVSGTRAGLRPGAVLSSRSPAWSRRGLCAQRVEDLNEGEAVEVGIPSVNSADSVLSHQNRGLQ